LRDRDTDVSKLKNIQRNTPRGVEKNNVGTDLDRGASSGFGATTKDAIKIATSSDFLLKRCSTNTESVASSFSVTLRLSGWATKFSSWLSEAISVTASSWGITGLWWVDHSVSTKFAARCGVSSSSSDAIRSSGGNRWRNNNGDRV